MLASVTAQTFTPHVGEVFRLRVDDDAAIDATLVEVAEAKWAYSPDERRIPFSLYFQTAAGRVLPQRIYRLEHSVVGVLDLFLVPTAASAEGVWYEAVFN